LGIGDWGLGIGDWAQSPIPNPQSPIPNPQFKFYKFNFFNTNFKLIIKTINKIYLTNDIIRFNHFIHFLIDLYNHYILKNKEFLKLELHNLLLHLD